jgi:hypothetical protein
MKTAPKKSTAPKNAPFSQAELDKHLKTLPMPKQPMPNRSPKRK